MSNSSNTTMKSLTLPLKTHKLIHPEELEAFAKKMRGEGKTIATLNGAFDILHSGHVQFIHEAAELADIVIVALNTDRSIQEYKSTSRPIVPLEQRLQMVAALEGVDYVTYFDETDPLELLKKINPDIHVNGAEYGPNCIESQVVKNIHLVDIVPGLSTTNIIQRIQQCDS